MLANSSDDPSLELKAVKAMVASADIHWRGRLLLLALNFLPLIHIIMLVAVWLMPWASLPARAWIFMAALYLLPPLLARLILSAARISQGRIAIGSRAFFGWWTTFQLQIIFCRLPALEEALRLIPGIYSLWLRLWGSRVGRLTYWSPGTVITDRSFLQIGDDVVFGAGVRLNAHVMARNKDGQMELILADLKIGDRVMVGGYSLLTAGTEINAGETTHACQLSPPFSLWQDGKRIKRPVDYE